MVCSVLPSGGWRGARGNGPSLAGARVRGAARGGLRAGRPHRRGGQELHGVRSAGRARRPADRAPHGAAGRPAAAFGRDLRVSSRDHRRADRGVRGVHRNGVHRDPEPRAARGSRQRLSRGRRRVCAALRAHLGQAVRVRQHVRDRRASAGRGAVRLAADLRRRARRAPLEGGVRLRVPGAPGRLRRFGAGVRPEVRRAADGNGARPHLPRSRRRQGGPDRRQLHRRRHPGSGPRGPGRRSALLPSIRGGAGGARGPAGAPPRDRPCAGRAGREDLGRRDAASQRARGRGAPGCRGHRARVARPDPAVSARIIRTYYAITALFNLAMSLIWGIDTLFKLGAGLDIFHVMLTNAAFTLGSMVFEIPTGVVADTVGRRTSLLLCLATLFVTTLLYVGIAWRGGGFWPFAAVSVFLGLGYTFYTGAADAWRVDALKATGYAEPLDPAFARGQMLFAAALLVGQIGGGLVAQTLLHIPSLARAAPAVPPADGFLCRGGALPRVRRGRRTGAAREAGLSQRPHSHRAARHHHLARLDVRQCRGRAGPVGLGVARPHALDRRGLGIRRRDLAPRPAALLGGAAERPAARRLLRVSPTAFYFALSAFWWTSRRRSRRSRRRSRRSARASRTSRRTSRRSARRSRRSCRASFTSRLFTSCRISRRSCRTSFTSPLTSRRSLRRPRPSWRTSP